MYKQACQQLKHWHIQQHEAWSTSAQEHVLYSSFQIIRNLWNQRTVSAYHTGRKGLAAPLAKFGAEYEWRICRAIVCEEPRNLVHCKPSLAIVSLCSFMKTADDLEQFKCCVWGSVRALRPRVLPTGFLYFAGEKAGLDIKRLPMVVCPNFPPRKLLS